MPAAPFASLQQRLNRAVLGRLADAMAQVGAGEPFAVLFEQPYAAAFDGQFDAAAPECLGDSAQLAGVQRGSAITINGTAYVVERAEPDGTGMTRLVLRPGA